MPETTTGGPTFTGLAVHRDLTHRFSLLYTDAWHSLELESDGGKGVILTPDPDDVSTSLSIESRELGTTVTGDDLPTLRDGLKQGLSQLRDLTIEFEDYESINKLVMLDVQFTYRDADDADDAPLRKRWLRLAYQGQIQVRLIAQGDVDSYTYWLPAFNQSMRTFQFADWWAELTGHSWLNTLKRDGEELTFDVAGEEEATSNE
ncbi:MAG: hypothetical protein U0841_31425 [Chloroflexia bacterium]